MFLRYSAWRMQLSFFILGFFWHFCPPLHPPNSPKNENLKKVKKGKKRKSGFPIGGHGGHGGSEKSWKICVKKFIFSKFAGLQATSKWTPSQVFFDSILTTHAPFMYWLKPLPPSQILKSPPCFQHLWETLHLEKSFYTSKPKTMIICCTVPVIWYVTDVTIFHFGLFSVLLPA